MKKNILAKNIKKLRLFKHMSQEEFSQLFDLKRATLGSYEEGRAEPKLEVLIKLATYFKLTLDDIVRKELTVNKIAHFDYPKQKAVEDNAIITQELKKINSRLGALELALKKSNTTR